MSKLLLFIISILACVNVEASIRVFTIGDSTTETWGENWYPCMGWGAVFQHFFDKDKVVVDNRAVGGTSTKTFYNEYWNDVIADINSGDYLFISFGANDSNTYSLGYTTTDEFIEYIGIFCNAAREKGAIPVLLSTVNRNWWYDTIIKSSYGMHPQAMKNAAEKYNTPFFDLYNFGLKLSNEVGPEYNTYYRHNNYHPNEYKGYPDGKEDGVHLQESGAIDYARYIVEEIENSTDERLKTLADATKPRYHVVIDADDESRMTSITRSATFPEGINVTMKSYGITEYDKCIWSNYKGEIVSTNSLFIYVMQDHDEHFTAIYDHSPAVKNVSSDYLTVLPDRIMFADDETHTIHIYSLNGALVSSASSKHEFPLNLPSGTYILTLDKARSVKITIK